MSKVIRLTESDLVKIIKRVIRENEMLEPNIDPNIMQCLEPYMGPDKIKLIPTCMTLFNETMKSQKIPNIFDARVTKCAGEMGGILSSENPFEIPSKVMQIGSCILSKMSKNEMTEQMNVDGVEGIKKTPMFKSKEDLINFANHERFTKGTWGTYEKNPEILFFNFSETTLGVSKMGGVMGNIAKKFIDTKGKKSGEWSIKNKTLLIDDQPV